MTKLLEKALEAVRRLSPDDQDQIALAMLTLSGHEGEPEDCAGGACASQAPPIRKRCRGRSRVPSLREMKLRFTSRAAQDLAEIGDYILEQSPQAALHVRARDS
jgi:hypothetical protein